MLAQLIVPVLAAFGALAAPASLSKRYSGVQIYAGRDGLCLGAAPKTGVGSEVRSVSCSDSNWATKWDIDYGSGSVILTGTGLALDAGSYPGNFGLLKVWTSYPGLYQQTWYLTGDQRIAITGGNQCLDEGDNGVQTYQCTTGNTNQIWYIRGGVAPSSSSAAPSSSSACATATVTVTVTATA